jgi:pimeloyl-ACP methyl ester carboxylesterase
VATDPTLVLAGDDDPIVPLVNGRILARRIADSRLHVVAGGGHLFLLERPAEIATVVADFLTPLGSPGAPGPGPRNRRPAGADAVAEG